MKAIGILFYFCLIPLLDGCLVVRTKQCECPLLMLSKENLNLVSDHSFHGNLTKYSLKEPKVTGDNCSVSVFCENERYELVVLDTVLATNVICVAFHGSGECECPLTKLSEVNSHLVSDHSFYGNLSKYQLKEPLVDGDNCAVSISCVDEDYQLVILSDDSVTNFGAYPAEAVCAMETQTWQVDDNSGFKTYQSTAQCTPQTPTTYLFAFSNDIDPYFIQHYRYEIASIRLEDSPKFQTIAYVRFDVQEEEEIKYYTKVDDWFSSLNKFTTDNTVASLPGQETDILNVLQKFMSNPRAPICGARIVAFTKRLLRNNNTQHIVNQLNKNHIALFTFGFKDNVEDETDWAMWRVASQTLGYGTFTQKDLSYNALINHYNLFPNDYQLAPDTYEIYVEINDASRIDRDLYVRIYSEEFVELKVRANIFKVNFAVLPSITGFRRENHRNTSPISHT
ncbi:hypothetical protein CAEBREN_24694 [Caenorhabditis brenneri]|uniref:Uncharacterized protein n=1 Tax=Caenorhabditis brenneri TaxID=135651 RepID=G0N2L5_CAEBE|nr:hypothetical protein CAEBREN_24694 [Caenorhabditis brenneri]